MGCLCPYCRQAWGHLLHSVRTGENAFRDLNGESVWEYRERNPEEGAIFDRAMTGNSRSALEALLKVYDFSSFRRIADIGGGHGRTIAGILAANPGMHGILFDQPQVVAKAGEVLSRSNVGDRCTVVAGNFFESVPDGADAYLLRMVIHDWEDEEAIAILKICRRAMNANAVLLLVEQVVAPPGEGPLIKFSDLNMLVMPGGRERTSEEFSALCAQSGFELRHVIPAGPRMNMIEVVPR